MSKAFRPDNILAKGQALIRIRSVDLISCDILSIDFEFHTLIAVSTSLCHNHAKNSKNRVRTEFLRSTGILMVPLFGLVRRLGKSWWVWGAVVTILFLAFVILIAPV